MDKSYSIRQPALALAAGLSIGILGGLIGLGGAEFRLPVLISFFALYPHRAVRFNLLVSFVTLAFAAVTRAKTQHVDFGAHADVVLSMTTGGILAAWVGAGWLKRVSATMLMTIIAALLILIAVMLVAEATVLGTSSASLPADPFLRATVGLAAGLLVGAVSSLLGVAGGEFIIPILIFVFGVDLKSAGTLSLMISLPVVAVGVGKHLLTGHYRSRDVLRHLVLPMSLGSVAGAIIGGLLSGYVPTDALKIVLAAILATSAVKLWNHREP